MSNKLHQRTKPRERLTVRVGPLERTLENLMAEVGQKVAMTLARYDQQSVKPLRARLDWLEKPLVVRAWLRCGQAWAWLRSGKGRAWVRARVTPTPVPVPETPAVPESPTPAA